MRKYCLDKSLSNFEVTSRPFWDSCKDGFEAMFGPHGQEMDRMAPHRFQFRGKEEPFETNQDLTNKNIEKNWDWYVTCRHDYSTESDDMEKEHFENKLLGWLNKSSDQEKPIALIHGRTGIGKTTFARHFFFNFLKNKHKELSEKTYFVRFSMPISGLDEKKVEDNIDHTMYKFLKSTFTSGQEINLKAKSTLIEMACLEHKDDPCQQNMFRNNKDCQPPSGSVKQLKWIREEVVGRLKNSEGTPIWADFNRLAIQYLCANSKYKFVFFFDNVDHLPAACQVNVWLVLRKKLDWFNSLYWKNLKFILAVRTYLFNKHLKEGPLGAYSGKYEEIELYPPSLYDVLRQRKQVFFDPIVPVRKLNDKNQYYIQYKTKRIPIACPNKLVDALLVAFKEQNKDKVIAQLCNHDLRQALEMAKSLFKSPFLEWERLAGMVFEQYQGQDIKPIVSFERIINVLLKESNMICNTTTPFFDNLFSIDGSNLFANSLCKIFILKLINERTYSYNEISNSMRILGHPGSIVKSAITHLLYSNMIVSPEGLDLKDHKIELLNCNGTTLCEAYLEILLCNLYYVQAMAYRTPFDKKAKNKVPLPTEIHGDDRDFEERVEAAHILLSQLEEDLNQQNGHVEQLSVEHKTIRDDYYTFGLNRVVDDIKIGISNDLRNIKGTGKFEKADWDNLFSWFCVEG